MLTEVEITGDEDAGAPAARIATVYSPAGTFWYPEMVPYATWCTTTSALGLWKE